MGRPSPGKYLEWHGKYIRVSYPVPKILDGELPSRLKKNLNTSSVEKANKMKVSIIRDMKTRISMEEQRLADTYEKTMAEAHAMSLIRPGYDDEDWTAFSSSVELRMLEILGPPKEIVTGFDEDGPFVDDIYYGFRQDLAYTFRAVATMDVNTEVAPFYRRYIDEAKITPRTKLEDLRAIRLLRQFCEVMDLGPDLMKLTKYDARTFERYLRNLPDAREPRTLKKYVYRLSNYWHFLEYNGFVAENIWTSVEIATPELDDDVKERAFTDEEVRRLLLGPAPQKLFDLMMIALLTGARIDVIVSLTVGDVRHGALLFEKRKREKGDRLVPIHPVLEEIIERRIAGKADDEDFFPEWPAKPEGSVETRSNPASKLFTRYRKLVSVDERLPGKRRSRVNFHSFRRWFASRLDQATNKDHVVQAIMGHHITNFTRRVYSEGPKLSKLEKVIKKVKMPKLDAGPLQSAPIARAQVRREGTPGEAVSPLLEPVDLSSIPAPEFELKRRP